MQKEFQLDRHIRLNSYPLGSIHRWVCRHSGWSLCIGCGKIDGSDHLTPQRHDMWPRLGSVTDSDSEMTVTSLEGLG